MMTVLMQGWANARIYVWLFDKNKVNAAGGKL